MTLEELDIIFNRIDDPGIYPKSVSGPNGYEKRSDFQEGWNRGLMEQAKLEAELYKTLRAEIRKTGTVEKQIPSDE